MNTYQGDSWGSEVLPSTERFDFTPGINLIVSVAVEGEGYRITTNNELIGTYPHQLPVTSVNRIRVHSEMNEVAQDVDLTVRFI